MTGGELTGDSKAQAIPRGELSNPQPPETCCLWKQDRYDRDGVDSLRGKGEPPSIPGLYDELADYDDWQLYLSMLVALLQSRVAFRAAANGEQ